MSNKKQIKEVYGQILAQQEIDKKAFHKAIENKSFGVRGHLQIPRYQVEKLGLTRLLKNNTCKYYLYDEVFSEWKKQNT